MCWKKEDEKYNNGGAFKATARDESGVIVTIIADNYYGYCKKEVKTQISYAANLLGLCQEEHAGGALAFASYSLGDHFLADSRVENSGQTFADVIKAWGPHITVDEKGYATDNHFPDIIYVPEDVSVDLPSKKVSWTKDGAAQSIMLLAGKVYVHPAGYKIRLEKHPGAPSWRLVGTAAEGTFCHKPCTVSGGGKSEISKSIADSIVYGPIYTADLEKDLDRVEEIFSRDYSNRFLPQFRHDYSDRGSRSILSAQRSLGSVIKLLTPSPGEFTDRYNAWLESIPNHIRALVFLIKRFYKPDWGENWRQYFTVDQVNGSPGNELKFGSRKLVGSYLRVGRGNEGSWRLHKLRQDFIAADKVQMEDDITASLVVPASRLGHVPKGYTNPALKLVENCEYRLFQRPDDAIHRGYDKQTEIDMSQPGLFASNYQPISAGDAREMAQDVVEFDKFTAPMRQTILKAAQKEEGYVVSSANPRQVNGKPSKNPRYLQIRPEVARPRDRYLAEVGARLLRRIPSEQPVLFPVSAVLSGRRNNPADATSGLRALAVYNPIHYQELPELFMDYICSLTGRSPSTTGAGSEGALTKGPFNALLPAADLNGALVDFVLTGYAGFSTAAGHIGPNVRVDHDISLLIPELWTRLSPAQRDPEFLIETGYLEKVKDFEHKGRPILASRLGYRITSKFLHDFCGKIFDNPARVFDEAILRPETQDLETFVDGVNNIVEAQQRVAKAYFTDGCINQVCPPLQALLRIMAGEQGEQISSPSLRAMFTRDYLLGSDWYSQRLLTRQQRDIALWTRHVTYLQHFLGRESHCDVAQRMDITSRLENARRKLREVSAGEYLTLLSGTIGADPLEVSRSASERNNETLQAIEG
jgi:hypothetical protein